MPYIRLFDIKYDQIGLILVEVVALSGHVFVLFRAPENKDKKQIRIFADGNDMNRDNQFGCITYRYVSFFEKTSLFVENSSKFYTLGKDEENSKVWKLLKCKYK